MNKEEAKKLFEKHHPEEAETIKHNTTYTKEAGCVRYGFKSALKVTKQLNENGTNGQTQD